MMRMILKVSTLCLGLSLMTACDKEQQQIEDTLPIETPTITLAEMEGSWQLERLGAKDALPGVTMKIEGPKISGYAGCNDYTATLTVTPDTLKVSDVVTTERDCEDGDMSRQEEAFLKDLASATSAGLVGEELVLKSDSAELGFVSDVTSKTPY